MSHPFPAGSYKIINVKNHNINADTFEFPTSIPVVAFPEGATWDVSVASPLNLKFVVHHLVIISKDGIPANFERKGPVPEAGIVVLVANTRQSLLPDVWCLHKVFENVYLIFASPNRDEHHGPYHWQLLSSERGTNVVVEANDEHPINKLLHGHVVGGLEASLDQLTEKLKELHEYHPESFWKFQILENEE